MSQGKKTSPAGPIAERVAVCSWSLQPADLADLVAKLHRTGLSRVQIALDPLRATPERWPNVSQSLRAAGVSLVSGMFSGIGEDYSSLETIRRTGGITPDATWAENLTNIQAAAKLAAELGLKLVTFHAGFFPDNEASQEFSKMMGRVAAVTELFASRKIALALETGQETAPTLAALLRKLSHPNLGVNFDPANMILYGKGDPIEAVHVLGPWIRQVHIKDARATRVPGTWGGEVPAGTGDVDWQIFFAALNQVHFTGNFVIEREAGAQRIDAIRAARDLVLRAAK